MVISVSSCAARWRSWRISQALWSTRAALRRHRQQQFLIGCVERLKPVTVHVDHTLNLAFELQRHGQFAAHTFADGNIAPLAGDVANAQRPAVFGDPTGDAFTEAQFEEHGLGSQPERILDVQLAGLGIEKHHRAAIGFGDTHGLAQDEADHLARVERGVERSADAVERLQPVELLAQIWIVGFHYALCFRNRHDLAGRAETDMRVCSGAAPQSPQGLTGRHAAAGKLVAVTD